MGALSQHWPTPLMLHSTRVMASDMAQPTTIRE
jgi:hypothetical protein